MALTKENASKIYSYDITLMTEEDKRYPRLVFDMDAYLSVINNPSPLDANPALLTNTLLKEINELYKLIG